QRLLDYGNVGRVRQREWDGPIFSCHKPRQSTDGQYRDRREDVQYRPGQALMTNRELRLRVEGRVLVSLVVTTVGLAPQPVSAQTLNDVLSFLLTNRSIATDDFVRDEAAASATRDAISSYLVTELATLPVSSSSGGFTYRLEPTLGTTLRSSDSFG